MLNTFLTYLNDQLSQTILGNFTPLFVNIFSLLFLGITAYYISKFILRLLAKIATKATHHSFDDSLRKHKVLSKSARLGSLTITWSMLNIFQANQSAGYEFILLGVELFAVFVFVQIAFALLNVFSDTYKQYSIAKDVPINGFIQVIKLFIFLITLTITASILTQKSPIYLLSSLGAITAVLLLIFRDTILGFVGGVQIIANRLISVGDWIEAPDFNADGEVLEIGLNTIKVQNWDKTISSFPTHSVLSNSFKNWKGMKESGGRRIKRSVLIDINSITELDNDWLNPKKPALPLLSECDLTYATSNLAVYRRYLEAWLKNYNRIHNDYTLIVRELAPTQHGVPIEVYGFANDNTWRNYEEIQADVVNQMIILLPRFDLVAFQQASGLDFQKAFSQNT